MFSLVEQRSALRRLLPRAMLANHSGSINMEGNSGRVNELEDTVGSSRSSFADIWDSTSIEVRIRRVFAMVTSPALEVHK